MQVGMAELGAAQAFENLYELLAQIEVMWRRLALELNVIEIPVKLNGGFEPFENDSVSLDVIDHHPHQHGDGARGGNIRLGKPLKAGELAQGRTAAEESSHPVAQAAVGIKL